jgi:hypothetical protein
MAFIGNTPTTQGFIPAVDFFNGNASTTAFTLSRPVASVAQVQAVVENVPQKPGDAYTISGNTITFTSAPPSGTNNIYVYYTSPITQVLAPSQGTVGTSALATGLDVTAGVLRVTSGIIANSATISTNYTITDGDNAISAGPVTIATGVTVTVPSGSVWTVT